MQICIEGNKTLVKSYVYLILRRIFARAKKKSLFLFRPVFCPWRGNVLLKALHSADSHMLLLDSYNR